VRGKIKHRCQCGSGNFRRGMYTGGPPSKDTHLLYEANFFCKTTWLLRELGIRLFERVHKSEKSDC